MIEPTDTAAVFAALGEYLAAMAPFMLAGIALSVLLETAWLRLFMRGEGNPVFPFRLGGEEGMYLLTLIVLIVLGFVIYLAGAVLLGVIVFAFALGGEALAAIGLVLGMIALLAILLVYLVRVSPALALSVQRRSLALGAAWGGTKAMFWPLFGSFLLAFIIAMVFSMVAMIVFLFLPFDMAGMDAQMQPVSWQLLVVPYAVLQVVNLVPQSIMRGIACKAALTIEEANAAPPPAPNATVNGGEA